MCGAKSLATKLDIADIDMYQVCALNIGNFVHIGDGAVIVRHSTDTYEMLTELFLLLHSLRDV